VPGEIERPWGIGEIERPWGIGEIERPWGIGESTPGSPIMAPSVDSARVAPCMHRSPGTQQ